MKTRIVMLGWMLAVALGVQGGIEQTLEGVRAKGGEYVRMPARFVVQQIESTARKSGDPTLAAFEVVVRVPGLENKRVSLVLESQNLLQALRALAAETDAALEFEGSAAVLVPASKAEAPATEPARPIETDPQRGRDEKVTFSDVDNALVFISSDAGSGSGFVAEMNGATYVFSNQHNFLGATSLELRAMHGGELEFEAFEFNRARDLVRFRLGPAAREDVTALRFSPVSPSIGQRVVVYGNSAGGNVATELRGEVLGVGPRDVEINAKIVPGNSGSPILNPEGEVIGVAAYQAAAPRLDERDPRAAAFTTPRLKKERRYGVRVPGTGWMQVDVRAFLRQTYALADMKSLLWVTHVLIQYWNGDEEYAEAAARVIDSFSSLDKKAAPPVRFHSSEMEARARMMTRAFKRNFAEFVELAQDERALSKLGDDKSMPKIARVDYHIRTSMLGRVKRAREELAQWNWMSETLKAEAKPLDAMILEMIRVLERETGIQQRAKAVK